MVTRKLVKQGAATLMISIPAKWAKQHNLEKGSKVEIEEQGPNLIIKKEGQASKIKIDVSGYSPLINRVLLSLYIRGAEELEINFSSIEEIKKFQKETINELLGFEIIKQTNRQLVVKDITKSDNNNIDKIIERIFLILDGMIEEFLNMMEKKEDISPIIDMDLGINKFVNYCLRILNTQGYQNPINTTQLYGIVYHLEEIGDIIKKIALESNRNKLDKIQKEILSKIRSLLMSFSEALSQFDKSRAIKIANIYENIKKMLKNKNETDFHIKDLVNTTIQMNNFLLVMKV